MIMINNTKTAVHIKLFKDSEAVVLNLGTMDSQGLVHRKIFRGIQFCGYFHSFLIDCFILQNPSHTSC